MAHQKMQLNRTLLSDFLKGWTKGWQGSMEANGQLYDKILNVCLCHCVLLPHDTAASQQSCKVTFC